MKNIDTPLIVGKGHKKKDDKKKSFGYQILGFGGGSVPKKYIVACGGAQTVTDGDFKIHFFTSDATFTISCAGNSAGNNVLQYLVIAGGGGAAGPGIGSGGGGGGGVRARGAHRARPPGLCVRRVRLRLHAVRLGGGPRHAVCRRLARAARRAADERAVDRHVAGVGQKQRGLGLAVDAEGGGERLLRRHEGGRHDERERLGQRGRVGGDRAEPGVLGRRGARWTSPETRAWRT